MDCVVSGGFRNTLSSTSMTTPLKAIPLLCCSWYKIFGGRIFSVHFIRLQANDNSCSNYNYFFQISNTHTWKPIIMHIVLIYFFSMTDPAERATRIPMKIVLVCVLEFA